MAHEIAKLLLEHADSFLKRTEAVKTAVDLGMPFNEIEQYMDWLDMVRGMLIENGQSPAQDEEKKSPDEDENESEESDSASSS